MEGGGSVECQVSGNVPRSYASDCDDSPVTELGTQ